MLVSVGVVMMAAVVGVAVVAEIVGAVVVVAPTVAAAVVPVVAVPLVPAAETASRNAAASAVEPPMMTGMGSELIDAFTVASGLAYIDGGMT